MKREELSHKFYSSVEELKKDVGEYAVFYNGMRPHERLGDKTPMQIEAEYWRQQESQKGKGIIEHTTITEQHSVLRQE